MEDEILDNGCGFTGEERDEREYKSLRGCDCKTEHVIHGYDGFSEDDATADLLEAGADDMFDRPYEDFAEYTMVPDADADEDIVAGSES